MGIAVVCLPLVALLLLTSVPVAAQEQAQPTAAELLERVAGAHDTPYQARQLVAYFGEPQSVALLDVRSSADGRFVRAESGGDVTRLWTRPELGIVAGEGGAIEERQPVHVVLRPDAVMAKYAVEVGESEEMLGTELRPLTFVRRRDAATVERWWVHPSEGVVYRRELYGPEGERVGMSTILEMRWGEPAVAETHDPQAEPTSRARTIDAPDAPPQLVHGYELVRTYGIEVDGRGAEQWLYSDGLHALSVFRTEGSMRAPETFEAAAIEGTDVAVGPGPGTWAWEGDGHSFVLVAEESALEAAELVDPFPRGGRSVWARLGSVWSRIAGAIADLFS